jgi:hypothetical protein
MMIAPPSELLTLQPTKSSWYSSKDIEDINHNSMETIEGILSTIMEKWYQG